MGTGEFDLSHLALTRDVAILKKEGLLEMPEMTCSCKPGRQKPKQQIVAATKKLNLEATHATYPSLNAPFKGDR